MPFMDDFNLLLSGVHECYLIVVFGCRLCHLLHFSFASGSEAQTSVLLVCSSTPCGNTGNISQVMIYLFFRSQTTLTLFVFAGVLWLHGHVVQRALMLRHNTRPVWLQTLHDKQRR